MIAGVFLTLATGACGPAETATDDDVVRVVVLPYLSMAPLHIAAEEGYFEARGLQVEFIRLNSVRDFLPMLITGQVDAAAGMMNVAMFNAMGEGGRLRAVAAVSELIPGDCPFTAFVTRRELRDSGVLESGEGVRGLRFDADPLLPEAYWIEAHLRTLGASVDDVEIIDLPEPNGAQLLLEGATDVASLGEPFLGMTTADPELVVWRSAADIVPAGRTTGGGGAVRGCPAGRHQAVPAGQDGAQPGARRVFHGAARPEGRLGLLARWPRVRPHRRGQDPRISGVGAPARPDRSRARRE
jgi:NitT/TauT family transport system substrate-binding protein